MYVDRMLHSCIIPLMNATHLITLNDAADRLPKRQGKKIHVKTLARWIVKGCHGAKLVATKIGGVWFTCDAWLIEFQRRCSMSESGSVPEGVAIALQQQARRSLEERYGFKYGQEENQEVAGEVSRMRQASETTRTLPVVLSLSPSRDAARSHH